MQGFNMGRYVPPDVEGVLSANQVSKKHALGSRARKVGQGILTVRFEMPFAIWCTTCPKPTIIGQGVRFNAEKKKVGNYHSTPIFSFRMKHTACGGWIEIRTDPKITDYVVTEGAKKRDYADAKFEAEGREMGGLIGMTPEEREKLQNDAFAALEVKIGDRKQVTTDKSRIEELYVESERHWDDPYEVSKRIRKGFRVERKEREKDSLNTEALKDRMSLGIELLNETEDDRRRAEFVEFGDASVGRELAVHKATAKPLFGSMTTSTSTHSAEKPSSRKSSSRQSARKQKESMLEKQRETLRHELRENTRAAIDPFLNQQTPSSSTSLFTAIRKKKSITDAADTTPTDRIVQASTSASTIAEPPNSANKVILVDYDSD
ncbi:hypothetical protein MMC25_006204 [Agyrium rufum]|nr:hypothetical protein [Agyrium rufum]